jgi:thioredoxin-related protein
MLRVLALVVALLALAPATAAARSERAGGLYVNETYSPRANPYQDLERGIQRATAENKRILIIVGGDWCVWCDILQRYLADEGEVHAAFEGSFVVVKVNWSRENENTAFLSGFPPAEGYPYFLILDRNGAYLGNQDTGALENGRGYDRARMLAFATRWRAP